MELKKIKGNEKNNSALSWLFAGKNHGLNDHQISEVIRVLIQKHDAMVDYINELESKFL